MLENDAIESDEASKAGNTTKIVDEFCDKKQNPTYNFSSKI